MYYNLNPKKYCFICNQIGANRMIIKILLQRIKENVFIINIYLLILSFMGLFLFVAKKRYLAFKVFSKVHRISRHKYVKSMLEPYIKKNIKLSHNLKISFKQEEIKNWFGSRIIVIKYPNIGQEKGVLYIMYNLVIDIIPHAFDMKRLLDDYILVLEPSYPGYCNEAMLQYTKYK